LLLCRVLLAKVLRHRLLYFRVVKPSLLLLSQPRLRVLTDCRMRSRLVMPFDKLTVWVSRTHYLAEHKITLRGLPYFRDFGEGGVDHLFAELHVGKFPALRIGALHHLHLHFLAQWSDHPLIEIFIGRVEDAFRALGLLLPLLLLKVLQQLVVFRLDALASLALIQHFPKRYAMILRLPLLRLRWAFGGEFPLWRPRLLARLCGLLLQVRPCRRRRRIRCSTRI